MGVAQQGQESTDYCETDSAETNVSPHIVPLAPHTASALYFYRKPVHVISPLKKPAPARVTELATLSTAAPQPRHPVTPRLVSVLQRFTK